MKNVFKLIGVIALVAIIGFGVTACGDGNQTPPSGGGTFTLTDISSLYENKYALFYAEFDTPNVILGCDSYDYIPNVKFDATGPMIFNGSVSIKSWCVDATGTSIKRYSGNDTYDVYFAIFNSQKVDLDTNNVTPIITIFFEDVKFTNGSAKRSWNEGVQQ